MILGCRISNLNSLLPAVLLACPLACVCMNLLARLTLLRLFGLLGYERLAVALCAQ